MHNVGEGALDLQLMGGGHKIPSSSTNLGIFVPKIYTISEFSFTFSDSDPPCLPQKQHFSIVFCLFQLLDGYKGFQRKITEKRFYRKILLRIFQT